MKSIYKIRVDEILTLHQLDFCYMRRKPQNSGKKIVKKLFLLPIFYQQGEEMLYVRCVNIYIDA